MIGISLAADIGAFAKGLDDWARRQLPFATAQALTATARKAVPAEQAMMRATLDRPEAFTQRGVAVIPARKDNPVAWVYIKPVQARYLAPSIRGGEQVLTSGQAILDPVDVKLDPYGNIPRRLLARLKGRIDIFIGVVETRSGPVNGVWQRPGKGRRGLKLLIRFADPKPIAARYPFGKATIAIARGVFPAELRAAMRQALATAR